MNLLNRLRLNRQIGKYIKEKFGVSKRFFFDALKMSPNAEGYVNGSITELLLKQELESKEFEVHRIKEKWEGAKHSNHHGDFYFKRNNEPWYVLESKGLKSNTEKWNKLYNRKTLINFLNKHKDKINWLNHNEEVEPQIETWIDKELPELKVKYKEIIYSFEEIKKYKTPKKQTEKSIAIETLRSLSREEISTLIDERLAYIMNKIKVLDSHFVSGTSKTNNREKSMPRIDEFNLISVDIFLRYTQHEFIYANPNDLEPSSSDDNHLQQNYIMGFIFNSDELSLSEEWHRNFNSAYKTLDDEDSISAADMQIDNRN